MQNMHLGIICAIDREYSLIRDHYSKIFQRRECCGREFYTGQISANLELSITECKIGKVSASITTALLISQFKATHVVFVGCAGSLTSDNQCGDIIVSEASAEHDFDGRPFAPICTILSIGKIRMQADTQLKNLVFKTCKKYADLEYMKIEGLSEFEITRPNVKLGLVATGDLFVKSEEEKDEILRRLPDADVVEMEGAAVSQACEEMNIPWCIVRVVSDSGDAFDFEAFANKIVGQVNFGIVSAIIDDVITHGYEHLNEKE